MKARVVNWNPRRHARCCIGCEYVFQKGDKVVVIGCLTIHYQRPCAEKYIADSVALGIKPDLEIVSA